MSAGRTFGDIDKPAWCAVGITGDDTNSSNGDHIADSAFFKGDNLPSDNAGRGSESKLPAGGIAEDIAFLTGGREGDGGCGRAGAADNVSANSRICKCLVITPYLI